MQDERFDVALLDEDDPFEIDQQVVPLAPSAYEDPRRCRPIGCYEAPTRLAERYRVDREER